MSGRWPGRAGWKAPVVVVVISCIVAIVLLGLWAWQAYSETAHADEAGKLAEAKSEVPVHKTTHDSMAVTYTYNGEMIRWYVLIDPDNGVQYIVNDRGGCCPRVSYDGSIMGVWGEDAS